jgi:hypothetical protein
MSLHYYQVPSRSVSLNKLFLVVVSPQFYQQLQEVFPVSIKVMAQSSTLILKCDLILYFAICSGTIKDLEFCLQCNLIDLDMSRVRACQAALERYPLPSQTHHRPYFQPHLPLRVNDSKAQCKS